MQVHDCESTYNGPEITDISPLLIQLARKPLYIASRQGQVRRVSDAFKRYGVNGIAIGWWELADFQYIRPNGQLNKDAFFGHDMVFISDPVRVHVKALPVYMRLKENLHRMSVKNA